MKLAATLALTLLLGVGCASAPKDDAPRQSLAARGFEEASRQLATELGLHRFRGWPAHAKLTGEPPRPHVRLGTIRNESGMALDVNALKAQLTQRLRDDGHVHVAPGREELASEQRPAARERDLRDDAGIMGPPVDQVSFLITGSMFDEVRTEDGVRTHTLLFDLRVVDLGDMSILVQTRTRSSEVLED